MDLELIIKNANPNIVIFLLTTLIAFITWLVKTLVEKPVSESKNTFNKFLEKRIETLTEVKTKLNFIAYFPEGQESLEFKTQLQDLILKDGKPGYLSKTTFNSIVNIAVNPTTNEKLLLDTIKQIDDELYLLISKIQDEINFYRRFSNYSPFKRFIGYTMLSLQYAFSILLIVSILFFLSYTFFIAGSLLRLVIISIVVIGIYLTDKWLSR